MKNQLIILCGGKGTRLGELTIDCPKPMLMFNGQPFLDYLLKIVCVLPFDEVIMLAGHLGDQIVDHYEEQIINGVKIRVIIDKKQAGTLTAFSDIINELCDNFWICNGDTFFTLKNLSKWSELFMSNKSNNSGIVSTRVSNPKRYGSLGIRDGKIYAFQEKSSQAHSNYINAGVCKLYKKDLVAAIKKGGNSLESDLLAKLAADGNLYHFDNLIDNFIDYGIQEDYSRMPELLRRIFNKKCLLWDRDNTLTIDHGYTYKIEDYVLCNNIHSILKIFSNDDFFNIIITNQSGVARGYYDINAVLKFHQHLKLDFIGKGIKIDDLKFCPHHSDGIVDGLSYQCECRKPGTLMISEATKFWNVDLSKCGFIGDSDTDELTAKALGMDFLRINNSDDFKQRLENFCNVDL